MSQIALAGVAVEFGARLIFQDVTFTVGRGERLGIVGRNGSGKTTLINVIAGRLAPTRGTVVRAGAPRFTLLDQHREFEPSAPVWSIAASPFAELAALEKSLEEQASQIGELGEKSTPEMLKRYDRDLERFSREGGYEYSARVDAVLHGLGFDPAAARQQPIGQLSGGEVGRIALARQLVAPAEVLLLDEPTNHLDLETTQWLEEYLRDLDATVLVISHDRAFLQNVSTAIVHVEAQTAIYYRGSYTSFVEQRNQGRLSDQRAYDTQQKVIAAEVEYIRRNIAGQNSRQAKGRRTRLSRLPRLTPPPDEESVMAIRLETSGRGGDQVLVAQDVRISIGSRVLFDDFSNRIERSEVIGLVGANGTGKSTLLEAITGAREVDSGEIRVGQSIETAYYRQDLAQVPTDKTLYDIIQDMRPLWDRGQVQGHLGRFGFSGDSVKRRSDTLSGGERSRVALAMMMLSHANFLLLDEPTNHLDVESIEALEDALDSFEGTVLLVSHDRAFLRGQVSRVWTLENKRITDFPGSFVEWEESRRDAERRAQEEAREAAELQRAREREKSKAKAKADSKNTPRPSQRALREAVARAETTVTELEQKVADLTRQLHDPGLYGTAEGVRHASIVKTELELKENELEAAMHEWSLAVEALETAGQ